MTFASNKITNFNTVSVSSELSILSSFKTATIVSFSNSLVDNNLQTIASLKISIAKKIAEGIGSHTIVMSKYDFTNLDLDSNTDLVKFVDWKTQKDKTDLHTNIDHLQCAVAVRTVAVDGYKMSGFTANAQISIYDQYNNANLGGGDLLNHITNLVPYTAMLDSENDEVVNVSLDGVLLIPGNVSSNIEIFRNCSKAYGFSSNYNYDQEAILGNFDYLQSYLDNLN